MVAALYDSLAATYTIDQFTAQETAAQLVQYTNVTSTENVLDLGCGPGLLLLEARRRTTGVVVGVDISQGMVADARRRVRDAGLAQGASRIVVLCDNVLTLAAVGPLLRSQCPGGYHVIFANWVFAHLTPQAERDSLALWSGFLAPGGRLVVERPLSPLVPSTLLIGVFNRPDRTDTRVVIELEMAPAQLWADSTAQLWSVVASVGGLTVRSARPYYETSVRWGTPLLLHAQDFVHSYLAGRPMSEEHLSRGEYRRLMALHSTLR